MRGLSKCHSGIDGVVQLDTKLMSTGVQGAALIATDAVVSVTPGLVKIALFNGLAMLNLDLAAAGLLIGLCAAPGAFVARRLLQHIPARVHAWGMALVVSVGAIVLI